MTASLRRCGGLFDAVRALVHLLCQLSQTIAPTVTDYRANCHGLLCQLPQIIRKNRTPLQLAFWVSMADTTFSISQMSRAKLAWTLPWREKVGTKPIRRDLIFRTVLYPTNLFIRVRMKIKSMTKKNKTQRTDISTKTHHGFSLLNQLPKQPNMKTKNT